MSCVVFGGSGRDIDIDGNNTVTEKCFFNKCAGIIILLDTRVQIVFKPMYRLNDWKNKDI